MRGPFLPPWSPTACCRNNGSTPFGQSLTPILWSRCNRRRDCGTQCAGWKRCTCRGGGASGSRRPRGSGCQRGGIRRSWSRCIAFEEELSHDLVLQPDEDLHFIGARQPLGGRRFPFHEVIAAGKVPPGLGFIVDELSI